MLQLYLDIILSASIVCLVTWAGSLMQTVGTVWTAHVPIGIAAGSDMMLAR